MPQVCWSVFQKYMIDVYSIVLLKTGKIPKTSSGKIQRYACKMKLINSDFEAIYHGYDATLVSSPTTAEKLAKIGLKNIITANLLGVDIAKYNDQNKELNYFEKAYKISGIEGKIKWLFLGRLTPYKGWNFTLNALIQCSDAIF